ncbi:MAG: GDP-mannose 4,6-dehydratase [Candidatus Micrarchaeota archaeon]|nr:GDP-mannose 4,6-dehydratase [Candidatus Micrarchaeota archaeon]
MKILITGGAGFLGSHLCERYVNQGETVVCFDSFINGDVNNVRHLVNKRNFKLVKGDVRDAGAVERVVEGADYVVHLAAQIHVDRSMIDPKLTYDINVGGTLNILEAARMTDVKRVLHASTSEVYGSAQYSPMDEKHPLDAPHPYGASKVAADRMCYSYIKTYGMDIGIIRSFNIFGPKQKDTGYGGAISLFTKRVMNDTPPIIFGDGKQTRDYTYVKDTVEAYDLALRYKGRIDEPINFGTGVDVKILDIANMVIKLCGKDGKMKPVHIEPRPGEVQRLIADSSKAKKMLGWKPKYSFEQGLKEYVDWYKNFRFESWSKAD